MEQASPASPLLFHFRLSLTLYLLGKIDLKLILYAVDDIRERGPNMMVMFAFEFAILATTILATTSRYVLSLIELRVVARASANDDEDIDGWERKGEFLFYLDLVTDFIKLCIYLAFFLLVVTFYGLPLHIIRDLYLTMRSFVTRIRDFLRYRQATSQMNIRYPDATEEEVARETTCIICREDMIVQNRDAAVEHPQPERMRPKKLPCGHVLHFGCLRSWLERQQRCPTCRRPVLDTATTPSNDVPAQEANPAAAPIAPQQPLAPGDGLPAAQQLLAVPPYDPANNQPPQSTSDTTPQYFRPAASTAPSTSSTTATTPSQTPIILPEGFELPTGWALLPMRQFANGLQQIQIRDNVWVTLATLQYVIPLGNGVLGVPPVDPIVNFGTPSTSTVSAAATPSTEPSTSSQPTTLAAENAETATSPGISTTTASVTNHQQPRLEDASE